MWSALIRFRPLLLVLLCAASVAVWACSPEFPDLLFIVNDRPDYPVEQFARGKLGILQARYPPRSLYVAYRYLTRQPFSPSEIERLQESFRGTLRLREGDVIAIAAAKEWWRTARQVSRVNSPPSSPRVFKSSDGRRHFLNCPADAFHTARQTLEDRIASLGPESPAVRDWIAAQSEVFKNCGGGLSIPAPAAAELPPVIRKDRDYQIAAAYFYAGQFGAARSRFQAIADDDDSPWRVLAPYLAARCLVRQWQLQGDVESAREAEAKLLAILADDGLSALHGPAQDLLGYIRYRLAPQQHYLSLSRRLLNQGTRPWSVADLGDFARLMNTRMDPRPEDDLGRWVQAWRQRWPFAEIRREWQSTASTPWLLLALLRLPSSHPGSEQLLSAASAIDPHSAGFPSIGFYQAVALLRQGRLEEAREVVDKVFRHHGDALSPSSLNALKMLRARLAPTLEDFLKDGPRLPAALVAPTTRDVVARPPGADQIEGKRWFRFIENNRHYYDDDVTELLAARLPLDLLASIARDSALEAHLQWQWVRAAWVRAVLLERYEVAAELAPALARLKPRLKEDIRAFLNASEEVRPLAAWLVIARNPGLRPQVESGLMRRAKIDRLSSFRDNWWKSYERCCGYCGTRFGRDLLERIYPQREDWRPAFLSEAEWKQASQERWLLSLLPPFGNLLTAMAVDLAEQFPQDPRIPELLHRAVRATRYGCTDDSLEGSRAAFRMLHRGYSETEWARRTPYWFR
ncbi:MAG TPA: hypothetical protein VLV83_16190 [Acidobacteriota bacterium]|nr:hypothetical protein [Acidobacteriota bacterium]